MAADSFKSFLDNLGAINMLRYKNLKKLDLEIRCETIRVQSEMHYFDYLLPL